MSLTQYQVNSTYGHCDTYFIETEAENGLYAQRAAAREHTRVMNRERQYQLGDELSKVTSAQYQDDILEHMQRMENETLPDVNSIDIQTEVQWFMRPYLLDFLIEAHSAFQLHEETLYLTINLLDRYCSKRVVYKRHYQLVGCAALLLASKYGDRKEKVPTVRELRAMCCKLYDEDMFTQMEWHILLTLDWSLGHPTIDSFLQIALADLPYDRELESMTSLICEVSLFHKEFVSIQPSIIARSSLALARHVLARVPEGSDWAQAFDNFTAINLMNKLRTPSAVLYKKYGTPQMCSVSRTVETFFIEQDRQLQRPQEIITASMDTDMWNAQDYAGTMRAAPHTPQKPTHELYANRGNYITPPITPDNPMYGGASQDKFMCTLPGVSSFSLTPPSSVESRSVPQYKYDYAPVQPSGLQNYYGI
ncbi:MAG: hypothetical protein M1828_002267 [Chrysothrix sp. TS-e1954]|nr:MAG: hypothetical protein M1828_002267 [Chrysothrix sp. TS-e1954]